MTWRFDCGFSFAISPNYNAVTFESYVHFHRKERKGTRGSGCRRVIRTEGCLGRPSDDRYRHVEETRRQPDDMIESTSSQGISRISVTLQVLSALGFILGPRVPCNRRESRSQRLTL